MKLTKKRKVLAGVAVVATVSLAVMFVSARAAFRLGANEPQATMVHDVVNRLDDGVSPDDLFKEQVDVASNMAPFIIVYDKYGKVVAGSGYLDGAVPQVPVGVLAASKDGGQNKVIWQPNGRVRIASVSEEADNYYVLGGRSLMVIDDKITALTRWTIVAWLGTLALLFVVCKVLERKPKQPEPKPAD